MKSKKSRKQVRKNERAQRRAGIVLGAADNRQESWIWMKAEVTTKREWQVPLSCFLL